MPRWQTYEVNVSDDYNSTEKTSQVKFETSQEMAADSPDLTTVRYARRSASPESSASTAGTSSSGGREGMTKRNEILTISLPSVSPVNKDAKPIRQPSKIFGICGWICACILGTVALIFVLLIYLLPTEGIFPVRVELNPKPDARIVRQGSLTIYPGFKFYSHENSSRYVYTISLDSTKALQNTQEILDVVNSYPLHNAKELPPPPYVHCWLKNPSRDHPCFFHEGWLGEFCSTDDSYGYNTTSQYINPCFLIRIENAGDWLPEPLRLEYVGDSWKHEYDPTFLGVSCRPKENDKSGVTFERHPIKGFSVLYFPANSFLPDAYLEPAVMVQVKGVPRNTNVSIECWIRAHNKYHLTDSGNVIINFVQRESQNEPELPVLSLNTPNAFVNLPKLQATHPSSSSPTTTTTSTLFTVDEMNSTMNISVDHRNATTNGSAVDVDYSDVSENSDYSDGGNMPPM